MKGGFTTLLTLILTVTVLYQMIKVNQLNSQIDLLKTNAVGILKKEMNEDLELSNKELKRQIDIYFNHSKGELDDEIKYKMDRLPF